MNRYKEEMNNIHAPELLIAKTMRRVHAEEKKLAGDEMTRPDLNLVPVVESKDNADNLINESNEESKGKTQKETDRDKRNKIRTILITVSSLAAAVILFFAVRSFNLRSENKNKGAEMTYDSAAVDSENYAESPEEIADEEMALSAESEDRSDETASDERDGAVQSVASGEYRTEAESIEDGTETAPDTYFNLGFEEDIDLSKYNVIELDVEKNAETSVAFCPKMDINDFKILSLQMSMEESTAAPDESGALHFSVSPIYEADSLKKGNAYVCGVSFEEDTPTRGISFTDVSGSERYFTLEISGKDGSLVLYPFTPDNE